MAESEHWTDSGDKTRKNPKIYLKAYKDLRCPYCGSNVYWGTHRCRRCGKNFPEELASEVDRRKMLHYMPIDYKSIAREHFVIYIITITIIAFVSLIAISFVYYNTIVGNVRVFYIISWAFFTTALLSTMLTIFFLSEPENNMFTRQTLQYALALFGIIGLITGFSGLIQAGLFDGSEFELAVCAVFIILAAMAVAMANPVWSSISAAQIAGLVIACIFLGNTLVFSFVRNNWTHTLLHFATYPDRSILIYLIGFIALAVAAYSIFHRAAFNIRLNICYPLWFAGMADLAVFAFFRAVLFRPVLALTYIESLVLVTGIITTALALILFIQKKLADNFIHDHLETARADSIRAQQLYSTGKYRESMAMHERLLAQNPVLAFGTTNEHPALELLGISFVFRLPKRPKAIKSVSAGQEPKTNIEQVPVKDFTGSGNSDSSRSDAVGSEAAKDTGSGEEVRDYTEVDDENERELVQAEAIALMKKSAFYEKAGQRQKALTALERSIKLDRSRAESWIKLGHILSRLGVDWERINSYYEWVTDIKLRAIIAWADSEQVPPQYALWLLEELAVLKDNMCGIGRAIRTMRTAGPGGRGATAGNRINS